MEQPSISRQPAKQELNAEEGQQAENKCIKRFPPANPQILQLLKNHLIKQKQNSQQLKLKTASTSKNDFETGDKNFIEGLTSISKSSCETTPEVLYTFISSSESDSSDSEENDSLSNEEIKLQTPGN